MKRTLTLSLAFSLLTATGAFASPHAAQPVVVDAAAQVASHLNSTRHELQVAESVGNKTFDRANVEQEQKVIVAENRKEFSSQYQRY